jgi:Domain of unknown function (DUF1963)
VNRADVIKHISASKLSHLRGPITQVISPAIGIISATPKRQPVILGNSRFGGLPDLPAKSRWPRSDSIPLMFVGQLNVKDLVRFKAASQLPSTGLLSFFFDGMLTGYGTGESLDRCRVIYTRSNETKLTRVPAPADVPPQFELYPEAAVAFQNKWTLPEFEEINADPYASIPAVTPIVETANDRASYQKMRKKVRGKYIENKILGHADDMHGGEIRFDAVLKLDKGYRFRYENHEWTNQKQLVARMQDLVLLLQWTIGIGVLHFWISRQDLEARVFDRVHADLGCG